MIHLIDPIIILRHRRVPTGDAVVEGARRLLADYPGEPSQPVRTSPDKSRR